MVPYSSVLAECLLRACSSASIAVSPLAEKDNDRIYRSVIVCIQEHHGIHVGPFMVYKRSQT